MIYLSGALTTAMRGHPRPDIGFMLNPANGQGGQGELAWMDWAADNGRFATPDTWDAGNWLEWLASLRRWRARCLFAVAPDTVGDAQATLALSLPYLPTIRQLGYRVAFVTQDGCTPVLVPWGGIDCLFVGGTDAWKLSESSWALCAEARQRGKWVHVGRVNSLRRLRACRVSLVDSADGTYVRFGPDRNLPKVWDWLDAVNGQAALEESA